MDGKKIPKRKKARYVVVSLVIALIALFVLLRFNSARAGNAPSEVAGTVVSLNVAKTVEAVASSLEAQPFANLKWGTSGVVEAVYVKAGDNVKAGDVLMKLNDKSVDSSILSAQADLATAQKDLEDLLVASDADLAQAVIDLKDAKETYDEANYYLTYLQTSQKVRHTETKIFIDDRAGKWRYRYKTKVVTGPAPQDWIIDALNDLALKKTQLDDAQRAYDRLKDGPNAQDVTVAHTKVDAAQATIDSMSVIAPFDGQVLYVESQPRALVDAESTALEMADLNHLYIEAQIGESDIASVSVGNPITATLDAVDGLELTGEVAAIDPLGVVGTDSSVQYTIRIDLDKLDELVSLSLPLGSTANVTIEVEPAKPSLAVPITTVQNDDKGEYVWVVQPNGSTKRVDVKASTIVNDLVVVTGDLKEGDSLATSQNNGIPGPRGGPFGGGN